MIEQDKRTIIYTTFILLVLQLLSLFDLPGYYFHVMKIMTLLGVIAIVYSIYQLENKFHTLMVGYIIIGALWNPIARVQMRRSDWVPFNIIAILFLGVVIAINWQDIKPSQKFHESLNKTNWVGILSNLFLLVIVVLMIWISISAINSGDSSIVVSLIVGILFFVILPIFWWDILDFFGNIIERFTNVFKKK